MHYIGNLSKFPVACPEGKPRKHGRCREVNVRATQALPHETVILYKRQHFFVIQYSLHREGFQQRQDDSPVLQALTGKLADDKGMGGDVSINEQTCKAGVSMPRTYREPSYRSPLPGIGLIRFWAPLDRAGLLPLSLANRASNPSLTNWVFSLMPVILDALSSRLSSTSSVVLTGPPPAFDMHRCAQLVHMIKRSLQGRSGDDFTGRRP